MLAAMNLKDLDKLKLSKYITDQLDSVTCFNCCKCYLVPTTATCGHSLCHTCWRVRRSCPLCLSQVDKKALKLNSPVQNLTEHAVALRRTFESLFDIQLDDFTLDTDEQQNVKEWLARSENQFSHPVTNSQQFTEESVKPIHQITSEIQIHTMNQKTKEPERETIKMNIQQQDWDKIEEMPEIETKKSLENPVGPMDIETFDFFMDDKDYNANNPRRSSRNKELKSSKPPVKNDVSSDKESGNSFNMNSDKMSNKIGQNWKNVKKMKKEFSKLNKKNKNKLNISIEMCKKAKLAANIGAPSKSQQVSYNIDDNSPEIAAIVENATKNTDFNNDNQTSKDSSKNLQISTLNTNINELEDIIQPVNQKELDLQNKENVNITASKVSFFKRGPLLNYTCPQSTFIGTNKTQIINVKNNNTDKVDTDDIKITIKIGNTLTNICIQKKENDMQFKINTDREVQTSLDNSKIENEYNVQQHIETGSNKNAVKVYKDIHTQESTSKAQIETSMSTEKNTTSANTSTTCFEIIKCTEKKIADHMETIPFVNKQSMTNHMENISLANKQDKNVPQKSSTNTTSTSKNTNSKNTNSTTKKDKLSLKNVEVISDSYFELLNDLDVFESDSVKEGNIQPLESAKSTLSAVIMPTVKSKPTTQKKTNKRGQDILCDTEDLPNKKMKIPQETITVSKNIEEKVVNQNNFMDAESENNNYDAIMSQVFANIKADMENLPKTGTSTQLRTQISNTQKSIDKNFPQSIKPNINQDKNKTINKKTCETAIQKCSENVFSLFDKEDGNSEIFKTTSHKLLGQTQRLKDNSLTSQREPIIDKAVDNKAKPASPINMDVVEFVTPIQDDDDKSVVEETPQKNTSFFKNKNKNEGTTLTDDAVVDQCLSTKKDKPLNEIQNQQIGSDIQGSMNVISISDSLGDTTEVEKTVLETPLTINKFFNKITYRSTPVAKKSLNFSGQNANNDPEETLCPSSVVAAKTTQEKEFMSKAFEQTLESPSQTLYAGKQLGRAKLCVAGSCLMASEQAMLKDLCLQRGWTYADKYTKDLTHLVVGVDEENKSQRSVKYICALASSKWIVTFFWVKKCLLVKGHVDEEPFEALDVTGEPGPRRSRLAKTKLLQGITFHCMGPFSIIDADTLKGVLEAAGGRVVDTAREVQAGRAPAMLLAEPEHTQEDRFIYIAMELKIVPMNYEWVINCLCTYTLKPIFDLLLCPADLLPRDISYWPSELISSYDE